MSTTTPTVGPEPGVLYAERLSASPRSWVWLLVAAGVTFFAIGPVIVPLTLVAWLINVARYANSSVRIDADRVWVGKRSARLAALDLSTLGRASNTWPWRSFNARYLGANPIWTRDSVGIRGVDGGQTYWVSVGTNRRDELVAVLERAIGDARAARRVGRQRVRGDAATAAGMARRSVAARHAAALVGRHPVDELHDGASQPGARVVIPMADENPLRRMPWATIVLILACFAVYFAVQPGQRTLDQVLNPTVERTTSEELRFIVDNAAIPCEITQGRPLTNREFRDTYGFGNTSACDHGDDQSGSHEPGKSVYLALLLSLFLHGSPQHLFGNMLFLWVFGNNIEDRQGPLRFLALYLLVGRRRDTRPRAQRSELDGPDHRRVGRHRRGDGRVSRLLPRREGEVRDLLRARTAAQDPRVLAARALVGHAVPVREHRHRVGRAPAVASRSARSSAATGAGATCAPAARSPPTPEPAPAIR